MPDPEHLTEEEEHEMDIEKILRFCESIAKQDIEDVIIDVGRTQCRCVICRSIWHDRDI